MHYLRYVTTIIMFGATGLAHYIGNNDSVNP